MAGPVIASVVVVNVLSFAQDDFGGVVGGDWGGEDRGAVSGGAGDLAGADDPADGFGSEADRADSTVRTAPFLTAAPTLAAAMAPATTGPPAAAAPPPAPAAACPPPPAAPADPTAAPPAPPVEAVPLEPTPAMPGVAVAFPVPVTPPIELGDPPPMADDIFW